MVYTINFSTSTGNSGAYQRNMRCLDMRLLWKLVTAKRFPHVNPTDLSMFLHVHSFSANYFRYKLSFNYNSTPIQWLSNTELLRMQIVLSPPSNIFSWATARKASLPWSCSQWFRIDQAKKTAQTKSNGSRYDRHLSNLSLNCSSIEDVITCTLTRPSGSLHISLATHHKIETRIARCRRIQPEGQPTT